MAEAVCKAMRLLVDVLVEREFCHLELILSLENTQKHLEWLTQRHASKTYSRKYLSEWCFTKKEYLTKTESNAYCRVHLQLASNHFKTLLEELKKTPQESVKELLINQHKAIHNTLHDIRPIADHLEQRKDPTYRFFEGGKSARVESFQLYRFSKALYYNPLSNENPLKYFFRESHVASAFSLRQALELKFERIIGVHIFNKNMESPRLKHGFHYEYAKKNLHLFDFLDLDFAPVKDVYNWCSHIVHNAIHPLAWQLPYAFEICDGLFASGDFGRNGGWSVHGGVRVLDKMQMQSDFAIHFTKSYDHGYWCILFAKPEASDFS